MIDLSAAILSSLSTATIAIVGFGYKWREDHIKLKTDYLAHKKTVDNTFGDISRELAAHEGRDQSRHNELLAANAATRKEIIELLIKNQK